METKLLELILLIAENSKTVNRNSIKQIKTCTNI